MVVLESDVDKLTYIYDGLKILLNENHQELVPIYEFFSRTLVKGKEKTLRKIARYFYYELSMTENLPSNTILSQKLHKTLEEEAYLQHKKFEKIKMDYRDHGAVFPDFELSPDVFWSLGVKNIIKNIGNHYDNPFEVSN